MFASLLKFGTTVSHSNAASYSFGPFFLFPDKRQLVCHGKQIKLGGRALDILVALVRRAGTLIAARELLAEVWPDTVVVEGSLRFHLVALRKALAESDPGVTYVMNVPGRGYTFVATVASSDTLQPGIGLKNAAPLPRDHFRFHRRGASIVGREREIDQIVRQLAEQRFVSIVGAGGMGKTTVANAAIDRLRDDFEGRVVSVDLSVVQDSDLVCSTLLAALCEGRESASSMSEVCASIGHTRTLVFLDCCEHLIDGVAKTVEVLYRNAAGIYILVTSREIVNVDGEFVFRLPPLDVPPPTEVLKARDALNYSAIRLFVERVVQAGCHFELTDDNAQAVSRLCRGLDGIALAIELAARQMPTFGLVGILELVDKKSRLMWHGRRTAVPRHQTLGATLDWSYGLLTGLEQVCLRRLAVFVGCFTLEAAVAVIGANDIERTDVMKAINQLSNKSLLDVRLYEGAVRYFLLDTTRSYARVKMEEAGEIDELSARHASWYAARWLDDDAAEEEEEATANRLAELGNLRAVLEWALIREQDLINGCKLVVSYAKLLLKKSMLGEARKWTEIALAKLGDDERGTLMELELTAAYGQALMFTSSDSEAVGRAYERGLSIAMSMGDAVRHDRLLCGLIMYLYRTSDFHGAFTFASEAAQWIAASGRDTSAVHSMLAVALHMKGDIAASARLWEPVILSGKASGMAAVEPAELGVNPYLRALSGKARNLWLTGDSDEAERVADEAIECARSLRHSATRCVTLLWAGEVFAWQENWPRLREIADEYEAVVQVNGFTPYRFAVLGLRGQIAYADGRPGESISLLEGCIDGLVKCHYTMPASMFRNSLAIALCANGDARRAILVCDEAIRLIESNEDRLYLPTLLITKASAHRIEGEHDASAACLREAFFVARRQGASVYESQIRQLAS
ncbi:Transcriptional regulator [Paraburkholderia sabiae]|uniref:ATP-binding protein n=1 Tax=Paraburkholderia sabiae TaxID=273251 RepID=UPI001CB10981|nr:winged helix-turn-helix domain-containing protein [Paraburkholderia sabiae]CAG9221510.1 Transcriptional regulator [Paraburkholderia sabiae]